MSSSQTSQITIYSTSWCAFCHTEKQWLDKLGISYIDKNIETDKAAYEELLVKNGGSFSGVPVTDIAGDIVLGFDRPKIQEAMKKHDIQAVVA